MVKQTGTVIERLIMCFISVRRTATTTCLGTWSIFTTPTSGSGPTLWNHASKRWSSLQNLNLILACSSVHYILYSRVKSNYADAHNHNNIIMQCVYKYPHHSHTLFDTQSHAHFLWFYAPIENLVCYLCLSGRQKVAELWLVVPPIPHLCGQNPVIIMYRYSIITSNV